MEIDLSDPAFQGANLTIKSVTPRGGTGDGLVEVGSILADGVDLRDVSVDGDLGRIVAGDAVVTTAAIRSLIVASLGTDTTTQATNTVSPLLSRVGGALGALAVRGDMGGALNVTGGTRGTIGTVMINGNLDGVAGGTTAGLIRAASNIGNVTVKGDVIGGADFSGIMAGGKLGAVKVNGDVTSTINKPVFLSAQGTFAPTTQAASVAIKSIAVAGNVLNARILAGFNTGAGATNEDASIGTILVSGNWESSSVSAGIRDTTNNGFGQNDNPIGTATPALLSTIASIVIRGTTIGSAAPGLVDPNGFFGITAERITTSTINGMTRTNATIAAAGTAGINLDTTNNNLRLVNTFA
jgi:hypothetical protein